MESQALDNELKRTLKALKKASLSDKLVIFVGAGASYDAGVPLWRELVNSMMQDLNMRDDCPDFLKIPQLFYNKRGQHEYFDKLKEVLKPGRQRPNGIHTEMLRLNPQHLITTNYDDLLEKAAKKLGKTYSVIRRDRDLPKASSNQWIIKMHGDFLHENIVLKEDDYLNYSESFPLIRQTVQGLFASSTILFVGFSFDDPNLKYILQEVRGKLQEFSRPCYFLTPEPLSRLQSDYLRKKLIFEVRVREQLDNQLNSIPKHDLVKSSLGKATQRRLRLIFDSDRILPFFNDPSFWDILELYLGKINGLKALPRYTLERIGQEINQYFDKDLSIYVGRKGSFKIHSTEIYNWWNDLLSTTYNSEYKSKREWRSLAEKRSLQKEYIERKKIIERMSELLSRSGFSSISINEKNPEEIFPERIELKTQVNQTDYAPIDIWLRFNSDELSKEINNLELTPNTGSIEDFRAPFLYFLMGDYHNSMRWYDEIKSKAFDEENYVQYFLANLGLEGLRKFWNPTVTALERPSHLEKIDLQEIVNHFPPGELIKELFQNIADGTLFFQNYSRYSAESRKERAISERKKVAILNGGDPSVLEAILYQTVSFFASNHLVQLFYVENKNIFEDAFEWKISSIINASHSSEQRLINPFYILLGLPLLDHTHFKEIISRQSKKLELEIIQWGRNGVLLSLENVLKLTTLRGFKAFEIIQNALLFLSLIFLNSEEKNRFVRLLITPNFRKLVQERSYLSTLCYPIFHRWKNEIDTYLLKEIIHLCIEDKPMDPIFGWTLEEYLNRTQREEPSILIDEIDFFLLHPFFSDHRNIVYLWGFLTDDQKNSKIRQITSDLKERPVLEYIDLFSYDIAKWNDPNLLEKALCEAEARVGSTGNPPEIIEIGREYKNENIIAFFALSLAKDGVNLDHSKVENLKFKSPLFHCFLAPSTFDFSKFNFRWVWFIKGDFAEGHFKNVENFHLEYKKRMKAGEIEEKFASVYRSKFF